MRIDSLLSEATSSVAKTLARALEGHRLTEEETIPLFDVTGVDLRALTVAADLLRKELVGDDVSYVINRNINFTNVCIKNCHFCAFARDIRSEQGYFLPASEIIARATQAKKFGATELCLQAGLAPTVDGRIYIDLTKQLREAVPDMHFHAYSPEEVKYGAIRSKVSFEDYLRELRDAGLGSLPGTSAEILDDTLRKKISPARITTDEWVEIVSTAHRLDIPTTATMMFGHMETIAQRVAHMGLIRKIQQDTGGFTEFVPLSFVHEESPLFNLDEQGGVRPGPTGNDVLRLYAISRLFLGRDIPNLQASWVKEGARFGQLLLDAGVNDLGGTLMNESISTTAGAKHGQLMTPAELRRIIRDAGRVPVQRDTLYNTIQRFENPAQDPHEALDDVGDIDATFGSYATLAVDESIRYAWEPQRQRAKSSS